MNAITIHHARTSAPISLLVTTRRPIARGGASVGQPAGADTYMAEFAAVTIGVPVAGFFVGWLFAGLLGGLIGLGLGSVAAVLWATRQFKGPGPGSPAGSLP